MTPGVSYTATVYAMTPAGDELTGPEGAFIQVIYYDASGNQISSYSPPNSVEILNSNSATGGPIAGSVGNQGWNYFSARTVAPANAATVNVVLETGAYTGLPGTAGGAVFWDDAEFGPTAADAGSLSAVNITNNGTITIGAGDTVATSGTFAQTGSGTLDIVLGGPPASGLYGSLTSAGAATLAGTLEAELASGYSPAVNDGFNVVTYPGVTGTFATYQLPSGSNYSFAAAVNPTYVGLGAVPTQLATTVSTGTSVGAVATNMLGVNLAWWDDQLTTPQTQQMVEAAGLTRLPLPRRLQLRRLPLQRIQQFRRLGRQHHPAVRPIRSKRRGRRPGDPRLWLGQSPGSRGRVGLPGRLSQRHDCDRRRTGME